MKKNKAGDGERGGDGRGAAALNADGQEGLPGEAHLSKTVK